MWRSFKNLFCILILLATSNLDLYGQGVQDQDLRQQIQSVDSTLDSLRIEHSRLMGEAAIVANRIELYSSKSQLNSREHRNLERQLQISQQIESEVQRVERSAIQLIQLRKGSVQVLVESLQAEIDSFLAAMESDPSIDRQRTLTRISQLFAEKQNWESQLRQDVQNIGTGPDITANPFDSAERLRMKRDLLLDREELIRREIELVEERIRSLREERDIRIKVAELTEDLDLFNEREELFARQVGNIQSNNNLAYWDAAVNEEASFRGGTSTDTRRPDYLSESLSRNANPDVDGRSPTMIQDTIDRLNVFQLRLTTMADSLNQRALWFQNEASKKQ